MKDKWLQYVEQKGELLLYAWAKLYKGRWEPTEEKDLGRNELLGEGIAI